MLFLCSFVFRTGLVESNIRKLVNDLEKNEFILIAHVNTEAVELPPEPVGNRYETERKRFLNLSNVFVCSAHDLYRDGFLGYHSTEQKCRYDTRQIYKQLFS